MAVKTDEVVVKPTAKTVDNETQKELSDILGESIDWSDGVTTEPSSEGLNLVEALAEDKSDESKDDDSEKPDVETTEEEETDDSSEDAEIEESKPSKEDIEYVPANGKKVKVDFNDREHIKKTYALAALARPMQARADKAMQELESLKKETAEDREILDKLDEYVEAGDDYNLYRLISGGKKLEALFEKWQEEQGKLATMSEEELAAYKDKKEVERKMAEIERRERLIEQREMEAQSKLSKSELKEQQSLVNSAFNKHRFAGTLGDRAREHRLDNMVFNSIRSTLATMEAISPELINEVIEHEFNAIRGTMNKTVETKASKVIKKVKNTATSKAQEAATGKKSKLKGNKPSEGDLLSGSLDDILANVSRYLSE